MQKKLILGVIVISVLILSISFASAFSLSSVVDWFKSFFSGPQYSPIDEASNISNYSCVDSDIGSSIYESGMSTIIGYYCNNTQVLETNGSAGCIFYSEVNKDTCINETTLLEVSCDFENISKEIFCENGCVNGACLGSNSLNNGLVAYYPLINNNTKDLSGFGRDGAWIGEASYALEATNKFVPNLSGSNYIYTTLAPNLGNDFTVSLWAKASSVNEYFGVLWSVGTNSGNNPALIHGGGGSYTLDNNLYFLSPYCGSGWFDTGYRFVDTGWHNFIVERRGDNYYFYVDGVQTPNVGSASGCGPTSGEFNIGYQQSSYWINGDWAGSYISDPQAGHYKGRINEVRVYNRTLLDQEIKTLAMHDSNTSQNITCYQNSDCGNSSTKKSCDGSSACTITESYQCNNPGTTQSSCTGGAGQSCTPCANGCSNGICINTSSAIVISYPFDGNLIDYSGNALSATSVNNPSFVSGKIGNSLSLNGNNQYLVYPSSDLSNYNAMTISSWIYPEMSSGAGNIVYHGNGGEFSLAYIPIDNLTGQISLGTKLGDSQWYSVSAPTKNNDWAYITAIWNKGDNLYLYINGELINFTSIPNYGLYNPGLEFESRIGAYGYKYAVKDLFRGEVDELKMYNQALSQSQIRSLYSEGYRNQTTNITTCTDSDGGLNYYVKGSASGIFGDGWNQAGQNGTIEDKCHVGTELDNRTLEEQNCYNNKISIPSLWICPNGCYDGSCIYGLGEIITLNEGEIIRARSSENGDTHRKIKIDYIDAIGVRINIDGTETNTLGEGEVYKLHDNSQLEIINIMYSSKETGISKVEFRIVSGSSQSCSTTEVETVRATNYIYESGINKVTLQKQFEGAWNDVCNEITNGDVCNLGDIEITIGEINKTLKTVSMTTNGLFTIKVNESHELTILNTNSMIFNGNDDDFFEVSSCSQVQSCQGLIYMMKYPSIEDINSYSFTNGYSRKYTGTWWINGNEERYTEYYTYWDAEPQGSNYQYLGYDVLVFDNPSIDASSILEESVSSQICTVKYYWVSGEEQRAYVCGPDSVSDQQNSGNYQYSSRKVAWQNNNVVISVHVGQGTQLTDEQVLKLAQERMNQFISDLKNNQQKYAGNFEINNPGNYLIEKTLAECNSQVSAPLRTGTNETCWPSWDCKMEPVICPEYGWQTKTCRDYSCDRDTSERVYCSPGICSGCYVPRWFNYYNKGDNICMPYGTRFIFEDGKASQIYQGKVVEELITESNGIINGAFEIRNDGTALAEIYSDVNLTNMSNGEIVSADIYFDGNIYHAKAGESLVIYPGYHQVDITYYDSYGNKVLSNGVTFEISKIVYSEDNAQSYIEVINRENYPAYCDVDGWVKRQKDKEGSEWARCQNNYECESNLCSYGECVNTKVLAEQASGFKGFVVKVLCKLSNVFDDASYTQCIIDNS